MDIKTTIVYQPIVSLEANLGYRIEGHEILSRFHGQDTQTAICSLERSGKIVDFDKKFIQEALELTHDQNISFNISNASVASEDFVAFAKSFLRGCSFPNASIEITETYRPNLNNLREFIDACHRADIKVGLDDFGSGYANQNLLTACDFDFVKIDGQLTKTFDSDFESRIKIAQAIEIAQNKNISITIERIEKAEQILIFESMGITKGQGYLFGAPRNEPFNNSEIRMNIIKARNLLMQKSHPARIVNIKPA